MFEDRKDAGQQLARALEKYKDRDVIVLGIPRGGVEVGYYVAKFLRAQFSMVVSRKLPLPDDLEAGFGAIAEDGSTFLIKHVAQRVPDSEIKAIQETQKLEIDRRIKTLRRGRPLPDLKDKTVILVDDGIAMGVTMRAAILLCRNKKVKKVVVAAPVAGEDVAVEIAELVDELVVLETPVLFQAVAQVYRHWYDVPDQEVLAIMDRWEKEESQSRFQKDRTATFDGKQKGRKGSMKNQEPQNCWEFWDCSGDTRTQCPSFPSAGRKCWEVASSPDRAGCSKAKGRGLLFCVERCAWFKKMNPQREI